jgi:hypothetical protein
MFAVSKYEHPTIYVRCYRTGETYKFFIDSDGAISHHEACFDQRDARRTAAAFLAGHRQSASQQISAVADVAAADGIAAFALVL